MSKCSVHEEIRGSAACGCGMRELSAEGRRRMERELKRAREAREEAQARIEAAGRAEAIARRIAEGHEDDCEGCDGTGTLCYPGGLETVYEPCPACEGTGVASPTAGPCDDCESPDALIDPVTAWACGELATLPAALGRYAGWLPEGEGVDRVFWAGELLGELEHAGADGELLLDGLCAVRAGVSLLAWRARPEGWAEVETSAEDEGEVRS